MSAPHFIAAIDQGTSSTRCMIFDRLGKVVSSDQIEHRQVYPQPGWVEHDPLEIWQNTQEVAQNALVRLGASAADLAAVGVTNQRETTVIWDRQTGQPYSPAIVWQDTRTDELIHQLSLDGGIDRFRKQTGLPLATYFSGPKIAWMLENVSGLRKAAERGEAIFGTIDTWILWNLTGGPKGGAHVTDVSNASRTLLMDLSTLDWDREILDILKIPPQILPQICSSSVLYGEAQGVLAGVPVAGDLGDQQAALFGQTCFKPGDAKNTYGTGCFMLLNTGTRPIPSQHGLLTTLGYRLGNQPGVYCLEGSVAIAGALVQWLRDNLGLIEKSSDIERLAKTVEDNGGIYFVPAFSGLFAPYWKSEARGVIAGLTRYANKGHLARAALEATAYQTYEILEAMEKDSGIHLSALKVDGGMVVDELLMQFQADILGVPVIRPRIAETTALGVAYAAGLAVGFWDSLDELKTHWQQDREWRPLMETSKRDSLIAGWKKAVSRSLDWVER
ncbi:MAG: glycerol kinase GlpK [Chloroflexi bacterium]|nr:glycerol kinase GlpK [Chloroflexota bacterium]